MLMVFSLRQGLGLRPILVKVKRYSRRMQSYWRRHLAAGTSDQLANPTPAQRGLLEGNCIRWL
ncbi:hypothetical protein BH23CHL1_BH23CHL1_11540 [soil metagenome]